MKKIIKTTILLTTIFSLCFGFKVLASIEADRASEGIESAGCTLYQIVSSSPYGNYTKIVDECGNDALVNTAQWNEYKLLTSQGFPEVIMVDAGWSDETFYAIQGYQLAGQPKVNLPKDKLIKITDPYNCDHLSILKRVSGQLNSSQYLFNQTKKEQEIKENNARINAERAKQQAQAKADQQQIDLNNQINAELNTKSENKAGQKTDLPYPSDYIKNYRIKAVEENHNKVWASFDNERNYVQQWLDKTGLKTLRKLVDNAYIEGIQHYGTQELAGIQYFKDIESGILPQNCSMGDWISYNLKKNLMGGWNGLAQWTDKVDISIVSYGGQYNDKLMSYQDIYNTNKEIYRMIESNLSTIYSYNYLTLEQKTSLVEQLNTQFISPFGSQGKKYVSGYESRTELINKIKHKWSTEYLTEADKEEMRKKGKDYWTEQQWKDYLD